jgi:hypothetical protein
MRDTIDQWFPNLLIRGPPSSIYFYRHKHCSLHKLFTLLVGGENFAGCKLISCKSTHFAMPNVYACDISVKKNVQQYIWVKNLNKKTFADMH